MSDQNSVRLDGGSRNTKGKRNLGEGEGIRERSFHTHGNRGCFQRKNPLHSLKGRKGGGQVGGGPLNTTLWAFFSGASGNYCRCASCGDPRLHFCPSKEGKGPLLKRKKQRYVLREILPRLSALGIGVREVLVGGGGGGESLCPKGCLSKSMSNKGPECRILSSSQAPVNREEKA